MSSTIAHRPHVHHHHAALLTLVLVVCAVLAASLVIWAVNQPEQGTIRVIDTKATPMPAAGPLVVPVPDSPVLRHAQMRAQMNGGSAGVSLGGRHLAEDATLDPVTTAALIGIAHGKAPLVER